MKVSTTGAHTRARDASTRPKWPAGTHPKHLGTALRTRLNPLSSRVAAMASSLTLPRVSSAQDSSLTLISPGCLPFVSLFSLNTSIFAVLATLVSSVRVLRLSIPLSSVRPAYTTHSS